MNLTIKSIAFCSVSDQALQPEALGISSASNQRGTRPVHYELRGEIPVIIKKRTIHSTVTKVRNQERGA